tara:strand:+ start:611 stop:889 length:279 start_codon:yes stop_codon:yes gene_type:complete
MKTNLKFKTQLIAFAYVLLVVVLFSSCSDADAINKSKCLDNVKRIYPNAKIYRNPDSNFKFFVVDSTGMREVTTQNLSDANVDGVVEFSLAE